MNLNHGLIEHVLSKDKDEKYYLLKSACIIYQYK